MSTTAQHSPETATVHLEGIGDVPALPTELRPVADLAVDGLPTRTWGVVAWPNNHTPELVERGKPNGIVAGRLAGAYVPEWGERVYLVYRAPQAVTVHTRDISRHGHTLGSVPVADDGCTAGVGWDHIMNDFTGDPEHDVEHNRLIFETWRRAHALPAGATGKQIITAINERPLDGHVYLAAYVRLLAEGLHEHAETAHRREHTHR